MTAVDELGGGASREIGEDRELRSGRLEDRARREGIEEVGEIRPDQRRIRSGCSRRLDRYQPQAILSDRRRQTRTDMTRSAECRIGSLDEVCDPTQSAPVRLRVHMRCRFRDADQRALDERRSHIRRRDEWGRI